MDPVGPWSAYAASYNRLAGATGGFQASPASGGGDFVTSHHHLAATGNTGLGSHQPPGGGVPSTTSQLLLQAAHTTATLAGQLGQLSAAAPGSTPSPFSPGGFLTPPSVGYDSVFSPLFHHANPKPAHYGSSINVSQHRQALAQAQAAAATKSNAVEPELSSIRENYSSAHQSIAAAAAAAASSNSFFEHQASSSSSSLPWSQGTSQLPSPFGILPHETVVTSSQGTASTKTNSSSYESTFNAHFVAAQSLNHLNSQLSAASDFNKSSNSYIENSNKKTTRSQSPSVTPVKPAVSSSSVSGGNSFYSQNSSTAYANSDSVSSRGNCTTLSGNFSSKSQHNTSSSEYTSNTKSYTTSSSLSQQQSCIVSTTTSSSVTSKDYRVPHPSSRSSNSVFLSSASGSSRPQQSAEKTSSRSQNFVPPTSKSSVHHGIQTKAQTKIYPDLGTSDHTRRRDNAHESSQSSPISFAMMDAVAHRQGLNYSSAQSTSSCGTGSNSAKVPPSGTHRNSNSNLQQFQHVLSPQTTPVTAAPTSTSYSSRHYSALAGNEATGDYHHSNRNVKSSNSTDSSYSERLLNSNNSSQNSPDCGVVVPRRPSPLQAHSQASPLSHVPSPGYPLYNSPIASMSSPSPLQLHSDTSANQCSNGNNRQHNSNPSSQQVTPASPLDVSVPRPASQSSQVAYSSVITRALTSGEGNSKSFNSETRSQHHQHQEFPQKQNCWDSGDRQVSSSRNAGKFTGNSASYNTPSNVGLDNPSVPPQNQSGSQVRGVSNITERQSAYFDSNPGQVTLQDLSNCRGDPMTIVKNLQTLHQPCQLQQPGSVSQPLKSDDRPLSKTNNNTNSSSNSGSSNKRRKSGEKANSNVANSVPNTSTPEFYARVPPPAHHNTHSSNQQTQNGAYFDFERWNLPPPPPKMFGGGPGAFGSQTSLHHGSNFVNSAHQHPSLMVPNPHHTAAPLPYFPAFPLHTPGQPPNQHPSHEFQASVNSTTRPNSENQPGSENSSCTGPNSVDDHPKVIVPNIEEELGFLAEVSDSPVTTTANNSVSAPVKSVYSSTAGNSSSTKMPEKKPFSYSNPASGFMASYMKFLQGERDTSPPQTKRGNKASWAKNKAYHPPPEAPKVTSSSVASTTAIVTSAATSAPSTSSTCSTTITKTSTESQPCAFKPKETPVYDPQDDPRYFPLKKERNGTFSDSDDEFEPCSSESAKKKELPKIKEDEKEEPDKSVDPSNEKDLKNKKDKIKLKSGTKTSLKPQSKLQTNQNSKSGSQTVTNQDNISDSSSGSSPENSTSKTSVSEVAQETIIPESRLPDDISKSGPSSDKAAGGEKAKKFSGKSRTGTKRKKEVEEENLPRRELARRKAKEKTLTNLKSLDQQALLDEEFEVDEPEFMDSDSDPAWTPAKDSSDDDMANRRRSRRSATLLSSRKRPRLVTPGVTEDEGASTDGSEDASTDRRRQKVKLPIKGKGRPRSLSTTLQILPSAPALVSVTSSAASDVVMDPNLGMEVDAATADKEEAATGSSNKESGNLSKKEESNEIPFKSGEFVVMKSDLKEENPPIWRIDGKTLLQKYESFQENGKTLYRNISTYSGWTSQNKHVYQQVRVKFRVQNRMETIVEFLRDELLSDDDVFERSMKETAKYQDNFEVYIQTLISQALDSNFLPEILQEGDEYFLASVKKVDEITEDHKQRLLKVTKWKPSVVTSVGAWPCFNVISDLPLDEDATKLCAACEKTAVSVRVQMYGQPYNSTTLEGCPPDPKVANEKDFLLCNTCLAQMELYHKVAHQKYLMFIECSQRVAEKRNQNDTTVILNELLANETWLNELFQSVRTSWAEIEKLAHQVEKGEK
ncbi:hypothetical protein R5R35_000976 [Gryllus longicercus]|uniref:DUF4211 domain-containing protein n=1 Tax=Gryllus longicercus TaxID=2509291 RepID=A0AAN9VAA8_9ORTH